MRFQLVVVLALCLSFTVLAGDNPNFSGKWTFSEEKSTLDQMGAAFVQSKMDITQADNEMVVKKTFAGPDGGEFESEEKLTLDGNECKSEAWGGSARVSTAKWSDGGDELVVASSITFNQDGQDMKVDTDEKWSVDKDGKALTIKHKSTSDWGTRDLTLVFTKAE